MEGPVTERLPLDALLRDPRLQASVWRGQRVADGATGVPSGYPALDAALPEGGFPAAALTEVFVPSSEPLAGLPAGLLPGKGELALVLPALARLSADRLIVLVAPPALPYAPALAAAGIDLERLVVVEARDARDTAWAAEQALRDGAAGAVLAWLDHGKSGSESDLFWGISDSRPPRNHPQGPRKFPKINPTPTPIFRRLQLAAEAGGALGVLYRPWAARRSASPAALRLALTPATDGVRVEVIKSRGSSARSSVVVALDDGFTRAGR